MLHFGSQPNVAAFGFDHLAKNATLETDTEEVSQVS